MSDSPSTPTDVDMLPIVNDGTAHALPPHPQVIDLDVQMAEVVSPSNLPVPRWAVLLNLEWYVFSSLKW